MRMTVPPRLGGAILVSTPSGTGSSVVFDAGAESVLHSPTRMGCPGARSPVGSSVSDTMYERPASLTPVTMRRIFPGMRNSYLRFGTLSDGANRLRLPLPGAARPNGLGQLVQNRYGALPTHAGIGDA